MTDNSNVGRKGKEGQKKIVNHDECDACGDEGNLLCCDHCPRSFHFDCLNPPVNPEDLTDEDWYCNKCYHDIYPEKRKPATDGPLKGLFETAIGMNPVNFELPQGTYEGLEEIERSRKKESKEAEAIAQDPRDELCAVCKLSGSMDAVSCQHCQALYHTYCLDPPLPFVPRLPWSCPQHSYLTHIIPDVKFSLHFDQRPDSARESELRREMEKPKLVEEDCPYWLLELAQGKEKTPAEELRQAMPDDVLVKQVAKFNESPMEITNALSPLFMQFLAWQRLMQIHSHHPLSWTAKEKRKRKKKAMSMPMPNGGQAIDPRVFEGKALVVDSSSEEEDSTDGEGTGRGKRKLQSSEDASTKKTKNAEGQAVRIPGVKKQPVKITSTTQIRLPDSKANGSTTPPPAPPSVPSPASTVKGEFPAAVRVPTVAPKKPMLTPQPHLKSPSQPVKASTPSLRPGSISGTPMKSSGTVAKGNVSGLPIKLSSGQNTPRTSPQVHPNMLKTSIAVPMKQVGQSQSQGQPGVKALISGPTNPPKLTPGNASTATSSPTANTPVKPFTLPNAPKSVILGANQIQTSQTAPHVLPLQPQTSHEVPAAISPESKNWATKKTTPARVEHPFAKIFDATGKLIHTMTKTMITLGRDAENCDVDVAELTENSRTISRIHTTITLENPAAVEGELYHFKFQCHGKHGMNIGDKSGWSKRRPTL
ncbi:Essential subunit of the histone deacetylase Rpd3S complex [Planoprotostelium fungivorum]|uniref:Essential subunit of the histone deacetylase Rpd3S complex n=1 Tax=Planoprotostelium fungivorum TaxID=1890364 RepID=A0A2P6NW07_9EUKA|nr:Essential subunit of the histone deacetylase Rpd3S complex [Planoprotostelium fungivorum]